VTPARLALVHGPTPLVRAQVRDEGLALSKLELWVKRDDATGGVEAGNKVRKLEFLLGDALARGADHVVTCGGLQSNHARATAVVCARLGLRCTLLLRVTDREASGPDRPAPRELLPTSGNVMIDRLVGAELRLITPADYAERSACMAAVAAEIARKGGKPYVIPEGGSNGLGSLGYVEAMAEVRAQLDCGLGGGPTPFEVVVHACGSGGTAAGVALGARKHKVAGRVRAVIVCDDATYFRKVTDRVVGEAMGWGGLSSPAPIDFDEDARGPRYGVMTGEQRAFVVRVARASGLVVDPVYTGKALYGLERAAAKGAIRPGARVLFLHTGGLPGLLAEGDAFAGEL